jgi:hypothetical protein
VASAIPSTSTYGNQSGPADRALDDPSLEPVAKLEGEVGAGPGLDPFRPPAAELGVEVAGLRQVTRVELEVDDRVGAKRRHRLVITV